MQRGNHYNGTGSSQSMEPTEKSSGGSSSSSSSDDDSSNESTGHPQPPMSHFWQEDVSQDASIFSTEEEGSIDATPPLPTQHQDQYDGTDASPTADKERQLLLLMLLAQVCALHDPTPRTFTVHVLELFERGILDRDSIRFLFDLGLVPKRPALTMQAAAKNVPPSDENEEMEASRRTNVEFLEPSSPLVRQGKGTRTSLGTLQEHDNDSAEGGALVLSSHTHHHESQIVVESKQPRRAPPPHRSHSLDPSQFLRTQEASAIRTQLAQQESHGKKHSSSQPTASTKSRLRRSTSEPPTSSWAVEHHPLSLSRYQREFYQVGPLNSGAFGHVYRATSKMDGRDYAIKCVAFNATGYSNASVSQVVREVQCLAQCDHPNCVRYYTSWLEPSWMTGSGGGGSSSSSSSAPKQQERKLLTDIHHMVLSGGQNVPDSIRNELSSSYRNNSTTTTTAASRRFSSWDDTCGESFDAADPDVSEYGSGDWEARDDSFVGLRHSSPPPGKAARKPHYRYQICLYIQMQLCRPTTLADWIRQRNHSSAVVSCSPSQEQQRAATAISVFAQLVRGIDHVHSKGILHRDLKPANVFLGEDGQFKIGDFGLSKLIQSATSCEHNYHHGLNESSSVPFQPLLLTHAAKDHQDCNNNDGDDDTTMFSMRPQDPLTSGIGTASYAAPEQLESRAGRGVYGPEADVFSLGLILLELLCNFATEHERILTFDDCRRHATLPEWLTQDYPDVAALLLACTHPCPAKRPTARVLLQSPVLLLLLQTTTTEQQQQQQDTALRHELREKDRVIAEKDRIIADLRAQMKSMSCRMGSNSDDEKGRRPRDVGLSADSPSEQEEDY